MTISIAFLIVACLVLFHWIGFFLTCLVNDTHSMNTSAGILIQRVSIPATYIVWFFFV